MIGPIRSARLPAEIKLEIVRATDGAKAAGMSLERACAVILLDPRRLRRWVRRARISRGSDETLARNAALRGAEGVVSEPAGSAAPSKASELTCADLADRPPVAHLARHRLSEQERAEILRAASEDALAHLRHRKLTHHLSRAQRVWCSESSVLRVLRAAGKVPVYHRRRRPDRPRPQARASGPNQTWDHDITTLPTIAGNYHLVPVLDRCSRKIVGRHFSPEATSASVQTAWGKALAAEGLLAEEGPALPVAHSDRGTQMTSRSTQSFFAELGIAQSFSRPKTPTDNAAC